MSRVGRVVGVIKSTWGILLSKRDIGINKNNDNNNYNYNYYNNNNNNSKNYVIWMLVSDVRIIIIIIIIIIMMMMMVVWMLRGIEKNIVIIIVIIQFKYTKEINGQNKIWKKYEFVKNLKIH